MGINPGKQALYCGYNVVAGATRATWGSNGGTTGQKFLQQRHTHGCVVVRERDVRPRRQPRVELHLHDERVDNNAVIIQNEGS